MKQLRAMAMVALAALATGCDGDPAGSLRSPDGPPRLGVTVTVVVSCPTNMVDGQSGQCSAAGYDSNGQFTGSSATWSTGQTSLVTLSSTGYVTAAHMGQGTAIIEATIGGVTGSANISVSLSSLSVAVWGPTSVKPNTSCFWEANPVSGGTSPYTYSWSRTGSSATGTDPYFYTSSGSNFTVTVTVTDAVGTRRSANKSVTVSSSAMICPI